MHSYDEASVNILSEHRLVLTRSKRKMRRTKLLRSSASPFCLPLRLIPWPQSRHKKDMKSTMKHPSKSHAASKNCWPGKGSRRLYRRLGVPGQSGRMKPHLHTLALCDRAHLPSWLRAPICNSCPPQPGKLGHGLKEAAPKTT